MNVPKKRADLITLAAGSVASVGKSWRNVAPQVNIAARPTRLLKGRKINETIQNRFQAI